MKARPDRDGFEKNNQPRGILVRQRLDECRVHKSEDGHAGADTERQHQDCGCRKSRIPAQLAQSEAQILRDALGSEGDDFPALFVQARIVTEVAASGVLRGFTRHAAGLQFSRLLIPVKAHFLFQIVVELFAANENEDLPEESSHHFH